MAAKSSGLRETILTAASAVLDPARRVAADDRAYAFSALARVDLPTALAMYGAPEFARLRPSVATVSGRVLAAAGREDDVADLVASVRRVTELDLPAPHALTAEELTGLVERAAHHSHTAQALSDHLQDALEAILPFEQRDDDIALLVLRVAEHEQSRS